MKGIKKCVVCELAIKDGEQSAVNTDTHKGVCMNMSIQGEFKGGKFVLPRRKVQQLKAIVAIHG